MPPLSPMEALEPNGNAHERRPFPQAGEIGAPPLPGASARRRRRNNRWHRVKPLPREPMLCKEGATEIKASGRAMKFHGPSTRLMLFPKRRLRLAAQAGRANPREGLPVPVFSPAPQRRRAASEARKMQFIAPLFNEARHVFSFDVDGGRVFVGVNSHELPTEILVKINDHPSGRIVQKAEGRHRTP